MDYRPISLVHSFAKLFTKVFAKRLAPELDSLVGQNQSAFIKGRIIHDNFEAVDLSAKGPFGTAQIHLQSCFLEKQLHEQLHEWGREDPFGTAS
jgi:hypothetical protein